MGTTKTNQSIIKIIKGSLSFTFKNIIVFLKFWAFPFFLSAIFYAISSYYITSNHWLISMLVAAVSIALNIAAASFWVPKWIRFYANPKKEMKIFSFDTQNQNYLKHSTIFLLSIGGLFFLAILLSTLIGTHSPTFGTAFSFCSFAAVFYLAYRFSFVLPAAALGEDITFMQSWNQSRGYSWKFFGLVVTLTFLVNLPVILMGLFSLLIYQLKMGMGLFGPFIFLGTLIVLFTNIIFFGAFTLAWTDFYKLIRQK